LVVLSGRIPHSQAKWVGAGCGPRTDICMQRWPVHIPERVSLEEAAVGRIIRPSPIVI
jgi:hypothetical protein